MAQMNLFTKQKQITDMENTLVVAEGERSWREWEPGVGRCEPLDLKEVSKKVLLHSTGNYIQSLEIDRDGR